MPAPPLPTKSFTSAQAWRTWLHKNHATSPGIILRLTRKSAGKGHIDYNDILEAALCYGWIDGIRKSHDATTFLQKFTPRARRSIWSKINRDKALLLIKSGRMHPAGQAEIDRAKADGRWARAYDSHSKSTIPPDLQAALDANPAAKAAFATLDATNRYAILFRTQTAKRADTRARRIAAFTDMLAQGKRIHDTTAKPRKKHGSAD